MWTAIKIIGFIALVCVVFIGIFGKKGAKKTLAVAGWIIVGALTLFGLIFMALVGDEGDYVLDFVFGCFFPASLVWTYYGMKREGEKIIAKAKAETARANAEIDAYGDNDQTLDQVEESLARQKKQRRQADMLRQRIALLEGELSGYSVTPPSGKGREVA